MMDENCPKIGVYSLSTSRGEGIAKQIEHIPFSDPHVAGIENYCSM